MKKLILTIWILNLSVACAKSDISSAQSQPDKTLSNSMVEKTVNKEQSDFSLEKLISSQKPTNKTLKWIAPNFAGLQPGKATQTDVIKTFGKPMDQFHPFSEYESTKHEWTFYYENINDFDGRISFIFNIRSKILKIVWLRPNYERPLTIERAIEIYGSDYFIRGIGNSICSSKTPVKLDYPFTIVYPQKGIYLWVTGENLVDDIVYTAKCP